MDSNLLDLAAAVSDDSQVDWDTAEAGAASDDERRAVAQLRQLAAVSRAARARMQTWGPLEIREEVGKGSFGTVYRAWDTRLEREVALKLLRGGETDAFSPAFIKEGRLLAKVRHPNVVTVYGADTYDGTIGIWMEFVSGQTLKEIVQEQGPFGAQEAALIGRDLCRAMAAVHQQGFLHRDIKAQNVMREAGGRIILMDFGAGVAMTASSAANPLAGTPAYLAPEVLNGAAPSVRSDIYGLGVLLYYLVTSRFPVTGSSLDEIVQCHDTGQRKLLRDARPDLPEEFVNAIDRAVAPAPEERPETAGAFERLLEGALGLRGRTTDAGVENIPASPSKYLQAVRRRPIRAAAAFIALVVATTAAVMTWRDRHAAPPKVLDSVAIVPFSTIGDAADADYLAAGITDDVTAHLASLRGLRIIAGASTRSYKDGNHPAVEIGRQLGVATVLDGSVQRQGDRLHVVVRLADAGTGEQLWTEIFDRDVRDIFAMQSEMSRRIAIALRGQLTAAENERLKPANGDFEAFNLYLKGRQSFLLRTEDDLQRAIGYFDEAIRRNPNYAPAFAGLSDAYTSLGTFGALPRSEAWKRASDAATRAVELDPNLAEAYASLGVVQKNRFQWSESEKSFKKAIQLQPGAPSPHHWYAILLLQLARFPEAITEIKAAINEDPLSIGANMEFAIVLFMATRYEDAIAQWQHALQLEPTFAVAYRGMATSYSYLDMHDRALELAAEAKRRSPPGAEDHDLNTDLARILARAGRRDEAASIAAEFTRRYETVGEDVAGNIAAIEAALDKPEEAFRWLKIAAEHGDPEMGYLKVEPGWETLRKDPRFDQLLATVGFPNTP